MALIILGILLGFLILVFGGVYFLTSAKMQSAKSAAARSAAARSAAERSAAKESTANIIEPKWSGVPFHPWESGVAHEAG